MATIDIHLESRTLLHKLCESTLHMLVEELLENDKCCVAGLHFVVND